MRLLCRIGRVDVLTMHVGNESFKMGEIYSYCVKSQWKIFNSLQIINANIGVQSILEQTKYYYR